jgi:hypothetical protein
LTVKLGSRGGFQQRSRLQILHEIASSLNQMTSS